jgi:hypothetical protein
VCDAVVLQCLSLGMKATYGTVVVQSSQIGFVEVPSVQVCKCKASRVQEMSYSPGSGAG